ncbi:helix-turn-helix domain-containing protein [Enterococcus faecium]|uniref:helix-turn-helix domain-containing protein n=1 Tax=Enterococcus faecium TaxID=1352 RepID=UPI0015E3D18C|nr:helix-turn-helix domain-containing protein [Enterococcus faecium]
MSEPFDKCPEWLYTYDKLTDSEKIVYIKIRALARNKGATVSNETLAEMTKKSIPTIKRILTKLEKLGLIERKTRFKKGYLKERTIVIPGTTGITDEPRTGITDEPRTGITDEPSTENYLTENYLTDNISCSDSELEAKKASEADACEKHEDNLSETDKSERKKKNLKYSEKDMRAAKKLKELVSELHPKTAEKMDLEKNANEIRLLHDVDGYSYKMIGEIMLWALNDDFWKRNIRSAKNLRKHFEQLQVKSGIRHSEPKQQETTEKVSEVTPELLDELFKNY